MQPHLFCVRISAIDFFLRIAIFMGIRGCLVLLRNIASIVDEIFIGISIGLIVSILPIGTNFLALILGLAIPITSFAVVHGKNFIRKGLCVAMIFGAIALCRALPVKELDQEVEPFHYDRISLWHLQESLFKNHGISVYTNNEKTGNRVVEFSVPRKMTKRMTLEKLARDTGLKLRIAYCGTGSSILFGGHPSFTTLEP
jgi:hypothetical protein